MSSAVEVGRGHWAETQGQASLLLLGPSHLEYQARPGDVWAAVVWRTTGVPMGTPVPWTQVLERSRVPWPAQVAGRGAMGLATAGCWYRVASGEENVPSRPRVSFPLGIAGTAVGLLVVYRLDPFSCPGCEAVWMEREAVANGYCARCRDWTGPAAPRADQLARRPFEELSVEAAAL